MNDELRAKLRELVYGLLDAAEAESLRTRISSDRDIAREYARVKLKSELMARAARASCEAGEWSDMTGDSLKASLARRALAEGRKQTGRAITTGFAAFLASILLLMIGDAYWHRESPLHLSAIKDAWSRLTNAHPRMLVAGPVCLERNHPATFEVVVRRLDDKPVQLPVTALLTDRDDNVVWTEQEFVDTTGVCRLNLPARNFEQDALQLTIVAEAQSERPRLKTWLSVTDRPEPQVIAMDQAVALENGMTLFRCVDLTPNFPQQPEKLIPAAITKQDTQSADSINQQLIQDLSRVRWGFAPLDVFDGQANESLAWAVPEQRSRTLSDERAWLVEVIRDNDVLLETRFVRPTEVDFVAASDWARPNEGPGERVVYDYSSAPPQLVYEETEIVQPTIRPLKIDVLFDRPEYLTGELIAAKIRVTDENDQPLQAVLGVKVESVPLEESETAAEARDSLNATYFTFASSTMPLPLVFDNGMEQLQRFRCSLESWQTARRIARRRLALSLLVGSCLGLGTLLLAARKRWLPRAAVWIPLAGTLGLTLFLGVVSLRTSSHEAWPHIVVAPLTNYGLQPHPPEAEKNIEKQMLPQATAWLKPAIDQPFAGNTDFQLPVELAAQLQHADVALDSFQFPTLGSYDSPFSDDSFKRGPSQYSQTVLWNPAVVTDVQGLAHTRFRLTNRPLCYRLVIAGHCQNRYGSASRLVPFVVTIVD